MGGGIKTNIRKTLYYLKRNGVRRTWYAVRERLDERRQPPYVWNPPDEKELEKQRRHWEQTGCSTSFSILVPAYRTNEVYLKELLESLRDQTYSNWELILADASEDDGVEQTVRGIADERIHYFRLEENGGIAANSSQALKRASGDYVGLLDHDDLLTPDALSEMAYAIEQAKRQGVLLRLLYSDEDKCNGDRTEYFEPNRKEDFNLDLLLCNNYICHFLVMKRELMQDLGFRSEYDGAQDYDLVLRAADRLFDREEEICHIKKVLYHWRCHSASTAENPASKIYAYEAGRKAVEDFARRRGWRVRVLETAHVGFYRLCYKDLFANRQDVGAVGGRLVRSSGSCSGRVCSGRLTKEGEAVYENLPVHYSGYLHRAILAQDAACVDIRNIIVREECRELFQKVTGVPYQTVSGTDVFDAFLLPADCDPIALSLALGEALRKAGYRILYLPIAVPDRKIGRSRK